MTRNTIGNIALTLITICLALVTIEIVFRALGMAAEPLWPERFDIYYFRDRPELLRDQRAEFAYEPHSAVRQVVVVVVTAEKRFVEYDTTLTTNNLGLVQRADTQPNERFIVVIGDSFAEGVGATPWFYDLEDEFQGRKRLANLGIVGTGVQHWEKIIGWFTLDHSISALVVLFIEDDFRRPLSWWKRDDKSIANCFDHKCSKPIGRLPYTDADFLPWSHPEPTWMKRHVKEFLLRTRLGVLVLDAKRVAFGLTQDFGQPDSDLEIKQFQENIAALNRIAAAFPLARFLHLPMADEARSGGWHRLSPAIREYFNTQRDDRYIDGMRECDQSIPIQI